MVVSGFERTLLKMINDIFKQLEPSTILMGFKPKQMALRGDLRHLGAASPLAGRQRPV